MKSIEDQLVEFFASSQSNKWLQTRDVQLYVRKGWHTDPEGKIIKTFDIATVEIENKSQGTFTAILDFIEKMVNVPIYIENVMNPRFAEFFKKRGYKSYPPPTEDLNLPCFISKY